MTETNTGTSTCSLHQIYCFTIFSSGWGEEEAKEKAKLKPRCSEADGACAPTAIFIFFLSNTELICTFNFNTFITQFIHNVSFFKA